MDSHLVTVKVSVVGGTHQRMQTQSGAFDEDRVKSLDTQTVQGRCTIEHDGMTFGDLSENIPHHGLSRFDLFLGAANSMGKITLFEMTDDEGFKEDHSHLLGQTALVDLELGSHNDDGTSGVVHTFTQQVLTETALFTFEHV